MWGSAARVNQRGTEWALSPPKNGLAGQRFICSHSFICGTIILEQIYKSLRLLWNSFAEAFKCLLQTSNLFLEKEISSYRSVLRHLSFRFPFLFTSSEGPRVSNQYWSTERGRPGAHPEQPVRHMSGWNQAILQPRKLHQRMSWTDRGCALQAASATSDCVTLLFWAQITKESLKGDPTIRWGDKSYTLIVYSDGTFGSNCDVSFF